MLLVRRRAPEGSYFNDGDRASGVFGVLATGFSVLLGFVIFLAFTSYDESRSGAETEALTVAQQVETAQLFPARGRAQLTGELVCYARSVVDQEWQRMENGTLGDELNPWAVRLFRPCTTSTRRPRVEQSAYGKWLDQTLDREEARIDRIHGAEGVIPTPALDRARSSSPVVIFVYMLFFADSAERATTQALLMGSVTAVISVMLLLLVFLDSPFRSGVGALRPVAMERTLRIIDEALGSLGVNGTGAHFPCDAAGRPR